MRDGIELSADVYLPEAGGPFPVVATLTPYNKNTVRAPLKARAYTSSGFAFVWADCRGRGDSDGEFIPYRNDGRDGYDLVEWIASQSWSSGAVGLWGRSYSGYNQWLIALEKPPHLLALAPYVAPPEPFAEWPTGTRIPLELPWFRYVHGRIAQHLDDIDWEEVYWHLPLLSMDRRGGFTSKAWRNDLRHPYKDPYWDPISYQSRIHEVDLPALNVSGWYDADQIGTVMNFALTGSAAAKQGKRLVMGPWDHLLTRSADSFQESLSPGSKERSATRNGRIDFGPTSDIDLDALEIRWFSRWLKGEELEIENDAPVSVFVMGANRWRTAKAWPLPETEWRRLHLQSQERANTRRGDGLLTVARPGYRHRVDAYIYDPADPVPFITSSSFVEIGGPDDYSEIEEREDVLVYDSARLAADLEVVGPIRAELYVSSDAPDTDFTAKLLDVHPSGYAQRLTDGIVRMRYRRGFFTPSAALKAEQVYRIAVDLWAIGHSFGEGHRIRLEIASSAFPKYDRNLNTGEPLATATRIRLARNRVWHGTRYSSHLSLPIIPHTSPRNEPREGEWPLMRRATGERPLPLSGVERRAD